MTPVLTKGIQSLLLSIHQDGGLTVPCPEQLDAFTAMHLRQAIDAGWIRDDSSGWDEEPRYVVTRKGRDAIGVEPWRLGWSWCIFGLIRTSRKKTKIAIAFLPGVCLVIILCGIVLSVLVARSPQETADWSSMIR